jgi:hypothetical protein
MGVLSTIKTEFMNEGFSVEDLEVQFAQSSRMLEQEELDLALSDRPVPRHMHSSRLFYVRELQADLQKARNDHRRAIEAGEYGYH